MYSTGWLIICMASIIFASWFTHPQSSLHISTLGGYLSDAVKVEWVGIGLASVYCMTHLLLRVQKPLISYITVTLPAPDVQNCTAIIS